MACIRRCIFTLVAFMRLFSTVHFQMSPQATRSRRGIITLIAFVQHYSAVCFQMCLKNTSIRGCILALVAICCHSPLRFHLIQTLILIHNNHRVWGYGLLSFALLMSLWYCGSLNLNICFRIERRTKKWKWDPSLWKGNGKLCPSLFGLSD